MRPILMARRLLLAAGVTKPPVDLGWICRYLKIALWEGESDHFDAIFIKIGLLSVISVNKNAYPLRKRFSIAHEIGHAVLAHPPVSACFAEMDAEVRPKRHEREADRFAAELLMPKVFLSQEWFRHSKEVLSARYKVSLQAMEIQLRELGFVREGKG